MIQEKMFSTYSWKQLKIPDQKLEHVAVLIPAYNETETIETTIKEVNNLGCKLVVINDASTDDTAKKVLSFTDLIYVENEKNLGKAGAIKAGLEALVKEQDLISEIKQIKTIILMDANQHPAWLIPYFTFLCDKYIAVFGARDFSKAPFTRKAANANSQFSYFIFNYRVKDPLFGFIAFKAELAEYLAYNLNRDARFLAEHDIKRLIIQYAIQHKKQITNLIDIPCPYGVKSRIKLIDVTKLAIADWLTPLTLKIHELFYPLSRLVDKTHKSLQHLLNNFYF